eukprot:jgi/Hompol1/1659/HPOL_004940-RA
MIFGGLWFASVMGIVLQISRPKLEQHVAGLSVCFLVTYIITTFVFYYSIDGVGMWGSVLQSPQIYTSQTVPFPVVNEQEITFTISILLICLASFMLQQHVREYAFNLLDRQHAVMNLYDQNADLKKQLKDPDDANILEVLENIDTWEFDIFELVKQTGGRPLYHLGMAIFQIYNFQSTFNVDETVMRAFLGKIESRYQANLYHNSAHAADVMHSMYYFLAVLGLSELVTTEDAFAGIVAAAMHDVDHPGYNNAFMIATSSPTAIRYNDVAVLEHYHASTGFDIMLNEPGCNVLGGVTPERYRTLRAAIVSMILATDMTAHFEFIGKFKNKINGAGLDFADPKDRQLCMDIAIKCGDINNATKSQALCTQWAMNIMEEFFRQGDAERSRGLPISMFMDRQTTVISKCQVGFIDYIVLPLYEAWDQYMNDDGKFPALNNLKANREYWKK